MSGRRRCDHLLDDSQVPGYQVVCLVCHQLWRYGPRAGAHQWKAATVAVTKRG